MSQYKDTSLKDLLQDFIKFRNDWIWAEEGDRQAVAEDEMQGIAGELNRRFYVTQQQNQALLMLVDALSNFLLSPDGQVGSLGDETEFNQALSAVRSKLMADQVHGQRP